MLADISDYSGRATSYPFPNSLEAKYSCRLDDLWLHLQERVDAILTDLGGDVGEVRREMVTRFVELTAIGDHLIVDIIDRRACGGIRLPARR